jgi:hypothetical protein
MTVPYTFANQSGNVPASELDANFANVKASADTAVVVTANAQPNITSVGTLTSLSVVGTSNVIIQTQADATWTFDNTGNLTLPASGSSSFTMTNVGNVAYSSNSPFSDGSGSLDFIDDNNAHYLDVLNAASFAPGTGDFTIEWYQYVTSDAHIYQRPFSLGLCCGTPNSLLVGLTEGSPDRIGIQTESGYNAFPGYANTLNSWQHIAVVRNSGTVTIYQNGVAFATQSITSNIAYNPANGWYLSIGCPYGGGSSEGIDAQFIGQLTNMRYVVGTAVYTGNFTPSTVPLTAILGTQLLLLATDPGSIDTALYAGGSQNTALIAAGTISVVSNGNTWNFDPTGNLTLPSNTASINYANGQPYGGGGGGIGNLAIIGTTIVIDAGAPETSVYISPSGESYAYLELPNNATANTVDTHLWNAAGNVEIGAGDASNFGPVYSWTFGADGSLNFPTLGNVTNPGFYYPPGPGKPPGPVDEIRWSTNTGNISISPGPSSKWNFGEDGVLTAPGNIQMSNTSGIYSSSAGYVVGLQMSNTEPSVKLVANNHEWMFDSNGVLKFPAGYSSTYPAITMGEPGNLLIQGYLNPNFSEDGGNVIVSGGFGDGNNGNATVLGQQVTIQAQLSATNGSPTYSWTFDATGNLTLPGNIITQYGNIESGTIGPGITIMANIDAGQYFNGLFVGNTTNRRQHYVEVDQEEVLLGVTNLGTNQTYQWTLSPDGNLNTPQGGYIGAAGAKGEGQMLTGGPGNIASLTSFYANGFYSGCFTANPDGTVNITTYTGNGIAGQWAFDNAGTLTVPGAIRTASNSQLELTESANTAYLGTTADDSTALYLTATTAQLYANGEVSISSNAGSGNAHGWAFDVDGNTNIPGDIISFGNIGITTNVGNTTQSWTFGTDGNLTFPSGNLVITPDYAAFSNAAVVSSVNNLITLSTGVTGGTSSLWVEDFGNIGTSNIAAVYANPVPGSGNVRIAVGTNGGSGPNLWDFSYNGASQSPVVEYASLTAVAGGRAFINDANLVATGNFGAQITGGAGNTVPVWSDGANWYIG